MVRNVDIPSVANKLTAEFDTLIEERTELHSQIAKLQTRANEIDRKLSGIQQTLQGLSLYVTSQETPTKLTKKFGSEYASIGEQMAQTLALLAGGEVPKTLTECCRDILQKNGEWMSAVQVRQALQAAGFDFSKYKSNPLASIHTTLKRLAQDEVDAETRPEGQFYRWKKGEDK